MISPRGIGPTVRVPVNKVNRQSIHNFLNDLIGGESDSEKISILKDVIVNEFCFNGVEDDRNMSELETEIHTSMKTDPSKKINCIKKVRDVTGIGLKEAKEYVEALSPGDPTYGSNPTAPRLIKNQINDRYLVALAERINRLAKDYGRPEPF
jgi:ribosomal protein L7/L12